MSGIFRNLKTTIKQNVTERLWDLREISLRDRKERFTRASLKAVSGENRKSSCLSPIERD